MNLLDFVFNYLFAWISVLVGIVLLSKYFLRKLAQKNKKFQQPNKKMRVTHILLGFLLIVTSLIHGLFSSDKFFSFNLGTLTWIVTVLLCVNYYLRKNLKWGKVNWLFFHRILSIAFVLCTILHVINVGGIGIFDALKPDETIYEAKIDLPDEVEMLPSSTPELASPTPTETPVLESSEAPSSTNEPVQEVVVKTIDPDSSAATSEPEVIPEETPAPTKKAEALKEYNKNLFGVVLKDGTYTGVAEAFGPDLTVSVTIKKNQVTGIKIVSHNERKSRFYTPAFEQIPKAIMKKQSLDIDIVAGSTYSSIGIINAVNDALSQAVVSGELPRMQILP